MANGNLSILLVWSCLIKSYLSDECSSESLETSNIDWKVANKELDHEENNAKCECCIAVSYVLHVTFETAHKNFPDTNRRLSYTDIIDTTGKLARSNKLCYIK